MEASFVSENCVETSRRLCRRWQELCARYLPVTSENSIWRYSRAHEAHDAEQGWKLHVSASVLTANRLLENVAPLLAAHGVLFKAPVSLQELMKINSGLDYDYCQVGKFITVYTRSNEEALVLAAKLHELTLGLPAPAIPFDLRYRPDSNVYYRYGSFRALTFENPDGTHTPAMRNPQGTLVPDLRDAETGKPDWICDLFSAEQTPVEDASPYSPLKTTFKVFRALTQRGKGGVYQAFDMSTGTPRLCVLKEGRQNGEPGWDGRDGYQRVKHEERVLLQLRSTGLDIPLVYGSFELEGNYYLATEFIEGENLQKLMHRKQRRIPIARVVRYGIQLADILSRIHTAGWVWRDCKPTNLIVTNKDFLRPLDFEGACLINQLDSQLWRTPAFTPPEARAGQPARAHVSEDLYAFGVILYFLFTAQLPERPTPLPIARLRRNVPDAVCSIVSAMLDADPLRRPFAEVVSHCLKATQTLRHVQDARGVKRRCKSGHLNADGVRFRRRTSESNLASERSSSTSGSTGKYKRYG